MPRLEALLVANGTKAAPVRNLHFKNLRWQHAKWDLPAIGWAGTQAGHYGLRLTGADEFRVKVIPVALEMNYAEGFLFEGCRFSQIGTAALGFGSGCNNNKITGCKVEDIGGNGIMFGWKGRASPDGSFIKGWGITDMPKDNEISDNLVRRCGASLHDAVGIFVAYTDGTRVLRNLVEDLPYSGISVGFTWTPDASTQKNCRVEGNHVRNVMNHVVDGAGLYTLGWQPGTVLKNNLIHDVNRRADSDGPENIGIFFRPGQQGVPGGKKPDFRLHLRAHQAVPLRDQVAYLRGQPVFERERKAVRIGIECGAGDYRPYPCFRIS